MNSLSLPPVEQGPALAVDLGGTKVAVALVTPTGEILQRSQETTCQTGILDGVAQVSRLLHGLLEEARLETASVSCVGIGIPAVLEPDSDRVIWAPNLNGWQDFDLRTALQANLGLPVFIEYDGHAAVLGEWWMGAGRGYQTLADVIVGTGIGGGMILEGKLFRGLNRLAGAAGWFALTTQAESQDERASSLGFWESLAAGPGLALYAKSQLMQHPQSKLWVVDQKGPLTAVDVFAAASQGDIFSVQLLEQLADWLGLGIANIISLINPEIIILGGGVGSQCEVLLPRIRQVVQRWAQPISARSVIITTSRLGSDAGLLGAAHGAFLRLAETPQFVKGGDIKPVKD